MKQQKTKFDVDVQAIQSTLEALDTLRELFEQRERENGITKKMLSELVGKNPSYISRVLNGRVSNINYKTLAQLLVAMDYLPDFRAQDCKNVHLIPNYVHSEVVEDHYERYPTTNWSISRGKENAVEVTKKPQFKEQLVSNG